MKSSLQEGPAVDQKNTGTPDAASRAAAHPRGLSRRTLFAATGTAGAVAAAAALLPRSPELPVEVAVAPTRPVDTDGGYRLSEHVQRYYQTARV